MSDEARMLWNITVRSRTIDLASHALACFQSLCRDEKSYGFHDYLMWIDPEKCTRDMNADMATIFMDFEKKSISYLIYVN